MRYATLRVEEYSMIEAALSPINHRMKRDSRRKWLSGLAVTLTTIVAYLAFWRIAPVPTFIIGCVALVGMLVAAWWFGKESNGPRGK